MSTCKSKKSDSKSGFDFEAMMEELRKESESYVEPQPGDGPEMGHLHPHQYYDEKWHMWFDKPKSNKTQAEDTEATTVDPKPKRPEASKPQVINHDDTNGCHNPANEAADIPSATIISADELESTTVVEVSTSNEEEAISATDESATIIEPTEVTTITNVTMMEKSKELILHEPVSKETSPPKATRISAKMRRRSREEFCATYLKKCDTKNGKPVTIEPGLMPRLYNLCLRSGDPKACPTYFINNLLKEIVPMMEEQSQDWK